MTGQQSTTPINPTSCLPFAGGIIERTLPDGTVELLLQTRWKPDRDPLYSGTFEFPAGKMDIPFENVYDTLKREIMEETGLTLKQVKNDSQTNEISLRQNDLAFGFRPFCCVQQLRNGQPWVGFIFLCEVENNRLPIPKHDETKNPQWVNRDVVKELIQTCPEKFFSLELPALKYYFGLNP